MTNRRLAARRTFQLFLERGTPPPMVTPPKTKGTDRFTSENVDIGLHVAYESRDRVKYSPIGITAKFESMHNVGVRTNRTVDSDTPTSFRGVSVKSHRRRTRVPGRPSGFAQKIRRHWISAILACPRIGTFYAADSRAPNERQCVHSRNITVRKS